MPRNSIFPVKKPYLKVQRDLGTSNTSSILKPDILSYSYSCVQEFKKNQHIIKNLAILHENNEYQGLSHQPEMFTLSGERENQVCQPFYCTDVSETARTETADLFESSDKPNFSINEIIQSSTNNTISDSEQIFFDKNVLLQWLKYQLKYVNLWWPFSKSKDYFFTRLCKKEKSMKMEMMLNNVDEETKYKIKKHVAELNLNLEERHNLCNESIIEIDITPIFSDIRQLQAFLLFLKNIEISSPELLNSQQQKHYFLQDSMNFTGGVFLNQVKNARSLFETNTLNLKRNFNTINTKMMENNIDGCHKEENNAVFVRQNRFNKTSNHKISRKFNNKAQYTYNNKNEHINTNVSKNRRKHLRVDIKSNQEVGKKAKHKSNTAFDVPNAQIFHGNNTNTENGNVHPTIIRGNACDKTIFCSQAIYTCCQPNSLNMPEKISQDSLIKNKLSCKCLIHQQREDYHRYKHQCLFGRGDEITNNLIKFVTVNENKYLSSSKNNISSTVCEALQTHNEIEARSFNANENYGQHIKRKTYHSFSEIGKNNTPIINKSLKNGNNNYDRYTNENTVMEQKLTLSKRSLDEISDTVTYDSIVDKLCLNNGNCHMVHKYDVEKLLCAIDYNKDNINSKKAGSFTNSIQSHNRGESSNENNNHLSFNACFESLNYSINSFTWNAISETANSLTDVEIDSANTGSKEESSVFFISDISEKKSSRKEMKILKNPRDWEKNVIASNIETTLTNNSHTPQMRRAFDQSGFNEKNFGAEEFFKDFIDQDLKQTYNDLLNYKITHSHKNLDENAKQKINLFVSNAKELQNKMAYLSKNLGLKRKGIDNRYNKNTSEELGKMNKFIQISELDIRNKIEDKQLKPSKISLSSFRPKLIYQSISSVFKGTHNYDFTKGKNNIKIAPNKQTLTKHLEEVGESIKYDQQKSTSLSRHKNKTTNSSGSSVMPCPDKLDYLIFSNLEKINSELKNQRNEIEALKNLILKH